VLKKLQNERTKKTNIHHYFFFIFSHSSTSFCDFTTKPPINSFPFSPKTAQNTPQNASFYPLAKKKYKMILIFFIHNVSILNKTEKENDGKMKNISKKLLLSLKKVVHLQPEKSNKVSLVF
jgi:hypothetical protein